MAAKEYLRAVGTGSTFQELSTDALANLPLALVQLDQQRRIADFLDDQVARLDASMAARRKQILGMEERLNSLIFAALRGDLSSGGSSTSSISWLQRTGVGWLEASVGSQFDVQLGKMLNEERSTGSRLRPYLRNTNVQWGAIHTDHLKVMDFPLRERMRYGLRRGDLLICEGGQPGRAAFWCEEGEMYYQKALHRARTRGRSSARWLFYSLRAAVAVRAFAGEGGTTIAHLTAEQLRATKFPFPDPAVQARLCDELDHASAQTSAAIAALTDSSELMKERKRALITAAVTGEFDVTTASGRGVE